MTALHWKRCTAILLAVSLLLGCRSTKTDTARAAQSSHLRSLVNLFNFAGSKLGHRPANEAEFKSFIAASAYAMLDSLHINSVDDLFISERDGQPFVVLYSEPTGAARDLIAYEQTGVAGKHLAGYSLGAIAELDDEQLAKLAPSANQSGK